MLQGDVWWASQEALHSPRYVVELSLLVLVMKWRVSLGGLSPALSDSYEGP